MIITGPAHRPSHEPQTEPSPPVARSAFLPRIQGLRGVAVIAVVLYHFWPGKVTGGYVGVDVFFVISGFLITGHLMREWQGKGRIDLGRFWSRRARRLLPAALLVLLCCAVVAAVPWLSPVSQLHAQMREIVAAAFYVENWSLALTSADYLAHSGDPTMAQHYWSLSVEEQFYVLWPLLILLAAWTAARWFGRRIQGTVLAAIAVVSALSFTFCVVFTASDPAAAYVVTVGRVWQFGVGATLALLPLCRVRKPALGLLVGGAGVACIVAAVMRFDAQTPFPGVAAALPTLGAAAVIMAESGARWWCPARLLSLSPLRFLGDISYSLYLWHWPLIVVAPSVPFWGLTIWHRLALLALSVLLAWLTKRFVEDPVRTWKPLVIRRPRVTALAALTAMTAVTVVALTGAAAGSAEYERNVQAIARLRAHPPACFGAAAVLRYGCHGESPRTVLPGPGFAGADRPQEDECFMQLNDARPVACEFGSTRADAPRVALIGDSHAFQLLSTFQRMARREGWHLTTFFKGACPWSTTPLATPGAFGDACARWRKGVERKLQRRHFDVIVTTALSATPFATGAHGSRQDAAVEGYRRAWQRQLARGTAIVALADNPTWDTDPNKCLRTHRPSACTRPRAVAVDAHDPLREAAASTPGVTLLDFTDVYCDREHCHPVVGGADVYRDQDHLTVSFTDSLAPQLTTAVRAALKRAGSVP